MADLDTDPNMMKGQQAKDVPGDAPKADHGAKDSDGQSAADRQAAKEGRADYPDEQMTAIFKENQRFENPEAPGDQEFSEGEKTDEGLARSGRSRLED